MDRLPKCFGCEDHVEDSAHGRGERKRHECHYTEEKKSIKRIEMQTSPKWCPKRIDSVTEPPKKAKVEEIPSIKEPAQPIIPPAPVSKYPVGEPAAPKAVSYEYRIQCYSEARREYLNVGLSQPVHNPGGARERLNDWKRRHERISRNSYDSKEFNINRTRIIKRKKTVSYGEWEEVED